MSGSYRHGNLFQHPLLTGNPPRHDVSTCCEGNLIGTKAVPVDRDIFLEPKQHLVTGKACTSVSPFFSGSVQYVR